MNNIKVDGFTRVSKTKARRLFDENMAIYLIPAKCRFTTTEFVVPIKICNGGDRSFDSIVNEFEYYNCNQELGRFRREFLPELWGRYER